MAEQQKQQQVQQFPEKPKTSAGAKVFVACKYPAGIVMQAFEMRDEREQVMGGFRDVRIARPKGKPVRVFGPAKRLGAEPHCRVVAGYAITEGVDKDTWDAWLEANLESALVVNEMVWAENSLSGIEDWARKRSKIRSGLEPMERDGDPRAPKAPNLTDIAQEDEQARRSAAA